MKVYELQGLDAHIDWATIPQWRPMGLFSSREKAQQEIDRVMSNKEWKMNWQSFTISPKEVR